MLGYLQSTSAFFSNLDYLFTMGMVCSFLCGLTSCDSADPSLLSAPDVPQLSVDQVHRGAFLGVWGSDNIQGTEKIWFVGGEVLNANESHSLIATYHPNTKSIDSLDQGVLQLEHEQVGGVLWWVWGSQSGQIWAAGEQGTLLKSEQSQEASAAPCEGDGRRLGTR